MAPVPVAPVPVTPRRLVQLLTDLIAAVTAGRLRVAVDGAPAAGPSGLADALGAAVRQRGRPAVRVRAADFLRPASLRLEHGRQDPHAYHATWLDAGGLRREVLDPWAAEGSGRYLPTLWDPVRDRATRAAYETAPDGGVLLVDGTFLLDRGLPFDLSVHLLLSPAALQRHTAAADQWTLPAYAGYPGETLADVVVRVDDLSRPAMEVRRQPSPGTPASHPEISR